MSRARHSQKSDRKCGPLADARRGTYTDLDQDGAALLQERAKNRSMTASFVLAVAPDREVGAMGKRCEQIQEVT